MIYLIACESILYQSFPYYRLKIDDLDWFNSFWVKAEGANNTKLPKDKGKYIDINTSKKYKDLSHTKMCGIW